MTRSRLVRYLPALAPVALFAFFAGLYVGGPHAPYFALLRAWGIEPFPWPFEDTETVMSALRCIRAGVDVYAANPCDPELRTFDYSPLWMGLSILPVTKSWLVPAGLAVDAAFLASLFLLPVGRDRRSILLLTSASLSTGVVFAVERGNNDLVLFVLAACAAGLLLRGWGRRCLAYAFLFLAGLLKFYPMLTLAVALRERPGRFAMVTLFSFLGLALFLVVTWHDLSRVLAIIPTGSPFGDMFGSIMFGLGLNHLTGMPEGYIAPVRFALMGLSLLCALRMGLQARTASALETLTPRECSFLLIGALLTVACFFTAQNIGYRVVHLLLTMPALLVLRGFGPDLRFRWMPGAVLLSLWGEFWRNHGPALAGYLFGDGGTASLLLWIVKQGVWWFLVTVFLAYLVAFAQRSAMGAWLRARLGVAPLAPEFSAA